MRAAIEVEGVSVTRDGRVVLEKVTAHAPLGGVTAIIGPNGAGKSTLLKAILGLVPIVGRIRFNDTGKAPTIGYVPQQLDFDRASPITVFDFMVMGSQRRPVWLGSPKWRRERARMNLAHVQAERLIDRPLGRLSGGELQRVQLALALQLEPSILLLDEPVSGFDVVGERMFCDLLERIHEESRITMVLVSHDLSVVARHASHVWRINREFLGEGPPRESLKPANLVATFGPRANLYMVAHPSTREGAGQ